MLHEEYTNGTALGVRRNTGYWSARKESRETERERERERERWRGHSAHIAVTHTIYSWSGHKSHNPGDSSAPHSGYCVANILRQERWASKWQKTERPIFYKFWQPGWLFHLCETRIDAGHLCFEREGGEGGGGLLYVSELLELVPAPESEWVREATSLLKRKKKSRILLFFLSVSPSHSLLSRPGTQCMLVSHYLTPPLTLIYVIPESWLGGEQAYSLDIYFIHLFPLT